MVTILLGVTCQTDGGDRYGEDGRIHAETMNSRWNRRRHLREAQSRADPKACRVGTHPCKA